MTDQNQDIQWIGRFTAQDRKEITDLRATQIAAIEQGNAEAYGRLCTDDVCLLLQGRELMTGRTAFIECEATLFRSARFPAIRQIPIRIERHAGLAVEVGRQETTVIGDAGLCDSFKTRRKYLHVLRKTRKGWRFASLMSNNSQ